MKISEVISRLTLAFANHGDLEFVVMTDVDGQFLIEQDRPVDFIEVELDEDGKGEMVCAVMPDDSFEDSTRTLKAVE